ncbi:CoA-transferase [Caballeronia jiangsuensis]|nr:CoA-transferase [Caballeronia jiangsuensis]
MTLLDGLRILTLEHFGAGPYGSMFLADLGAEVIKIESGVQGGDASRHVGPHMLGKGDSQYFQTFNTNKRSVSLDIKTDEGREAFLRLVESADAVINNLRGDQPAKLAIDYAHLKSANPAIVCLHISAYGRDNPRRSWPGYDFLMQAEAGLMSLTGEPGGPPSRNGVSMIDFMTGMTGVTGLLSGVLHARKTGIGCDIDASLFDVALHQLTYPGTWHLNEGDVPTRLSRGSHLSVAPVQTFPTSDGWIFVACMMEKFWQVLLKLSGNEALGADPRFATPGARHTHRDALTDALDPIFASRSTADWLALLSGHLPVAPVYDVAQALANPFVEEVGMINRVPHPSKQDFRILSNPLKVNGQRLAQQVCAPLGHDDADLLGPLVSHDAAR